MSPFKTFYAQEITTWLKQNPGRVITVYQIGELFGKGLYESCGFRDSSYGFRKTGFFPVNRNVFREEEFVAESLHQVFPLPDTDEVPLLVEEPEVTETDLSTS